MNSPEAKKILAAVRPDSRDREDRKVAEALRQLQRDPALKLWFEKHSAFQLKLQESFRKISPPAGLSDRILSGDKLVASIAWWRQPVVWAAAAAVLLLIALSAYWLDLGSGDSFAVYRSRMVRTALREYRMDVVTNDLAQIRQFLSKNSAPSDFELAGRLAQLSPVGAGLLSWQGERVSMVCLDSGQQSVLFLFIVDRSGVSQAPALDPEFVQVNKLMTASWAKGDKAYVLAAPEDAKAIRNYFRDTSDAKE